MKKIIFTGGGTVGHVTLNLLLIPKFLEDGWEVHYIGDKKGIEYQQIVQSGLPVVFHGISTGKLRRYFSWQNLLDIFKVSWGILQSLGILLKVRPQALFSKGGFVSVPPVIASRLTGVPVFIHESDLSMGLANKIAYKFATKMYSTFEQSEELSKIEHVGAVTKVLGKQEGDLDFLTPFFDQELPTILFVGGSGGAKVFNDFIVQNKEELVTSYNIINITGHSELNELSSHLYRVDYVTDLYLPLMQYADVVVTRGGSNTLFELLAMKKLHLIVPLGREASRGDQLENAAYFEKKGYSEQLLEQDLTLDNVSTSLAHLLQNQTRYQESMAATNEIKSVQDFYQILMKDMKRGEDA